jgi:hypothetical protein
MNYVLTGFNLYSGVQESRSFYHKAINFYNEPEKTTRHYIMIAVETAVFVSKITTVAFNIIRIWTQNQQTGGILQEQLLRYSLISNGLTLSTQIFLNILKGEQPLRGLENWQVLAQIIENAGSLSGHNYQVYARLVDIICMMIQNRRIIPARIRNPADRLIQSICSYCLTFLFPDQIPSQIMGFDIGAIEFNARYEDIPLEHSQNEVFRRYTCPLMQRPIRYPIIILNHQQNGLMRLPIEFFERKALLSTLRRRETSVYPQTNESITSNQLKENLTIRYFIEEEMRRLGLIPFNE